ncbi:MAG: alkylmercury lyase family protein [Thermoplasmata archaeon]|nr:MAG: alkylmercury lyase family protein [Thermoplasmata archaeon]
MSIFRKQDENGNYPIKPKLTERLERILDGIYGIENMDAKFGKALSREENEIRLFVLTQSPVLGHIPSTDEIRKAFSQLSIEEVDAILNLLDKKDIIHLNDERTLITAAYPFSATETSHFVNLKKEGFKKMYAMCAIDALGMPFMFNCDASIHSKCAHCNDDVELEIKNNEIIFPEPRNVVVWYDLDLSCCAAASCCPNTNFFSAKEHFLQWQQENKARKGNLVLIGEALYLGKFYFENRLKDNG